MLPKRIYYVKSYTTAGTGDVLFYAEFQPVNPKTGRPRRIVPTGPGACHYLSNWKTREYEPEEWTENGRWTGVDTHFRTFDDARNACRDHAKLL